jgi:hypothetical protein
MPQGGSTTNPEEMSKACYDFYSSLYSAQTELAADRLIQELIRRLIPRKITPKMNLKLSSPIGLEEFEQAMKAMANEKAPGPNRVGIDFFLSVLDTSRATLP